MEKKTKKLQLRKETIAVLNGERMSHVIGGLNRCEPPYAMIEVGGVEYCSIADTAYCDESGDMGTSQNGEMCQDTVGSFQNCRPTYKETQCMCS